MGLGDKGGEFNKVFLDTFQRVVLRNLARNTPWFSRPELIEIVAGSVALMNLYRTAMPLNMLRRVLVVAMTALFIGAFLLPATRKVFDLPVVNNVWAYGLAAVFIVLAYPLLVLGSRVSQRVHDRRLASHA